MKKKCPITNILTQLGIKDIKSDVFGLSENEKRDRKVIPWQWLLWGALLAFIFGFILHSFSIWIVILAIAVSLIFYLAKNTESVEKQVFLLTDESHKNKEGVSQNTIIPTTTKRKSTKKNKINKTKTRSVSKTSSKVAKNTARKSTLAKKATKKALKKRKKTRQLKSPPLKGKVAK